MMHNIYKDYSDSRYGRLYIYLYGAELPYVHGEDERRRPVERRAGELPGGGLRGVVEVPEDVAGPVVAVEAQRSAPDLGVHVAEPAARRLGLGEPVRRRLVDVPEQRGGGVEERVVHVGVARGHAAEEGRRGGVVAHGDAVGQGAAVLGGAELPQRRGAPHGPRAQEQHLARAQAVEPLQLPRERLDQLVHELLRRVGGAGGGGQLGGGVGFGVVDDVVAADGDGEEGLGQVSRGLRLPQALHQRRVHRRQVVDLLVEADALVLCMQHNIV